MKKRKFLALNMILAALGLLIYCGSFYVKSYEQNRVAKEGYEAISLLALGAETDKDLEDSQGSNGKFSPKEAGEDSKTDADDEEADRKDKKKEKKKKENTDSTTGTEKKKAEKSKKKQESKADKIRESFGISWENLRKINPEVAAWITISGADISYPVVQGTDDEYYLKHNFQGKEDLFGCVFLGHDNKKNLTDSHSFLYGHNMEGNMMFANLNRYERPEFLQSCPTFEITTSERKYFYRIFSVEQAAPQSAAFEYGYQLKSRAYKLQLSILKENSMYDTGVMPQETQRMVTLITCNSRLDKEIRMAVHGICYEIVKAE